MFLLRRITKVTSTHLEHAKIYCFYTATIIKRQHLEVTFIRTLRVLLLYTNVIRK
jgi:hypothetical protein